MRFDALSRNLNVFEPHFLEASAGTGKTFAIEHLVVRLLIESSTPLLIEQILVVTFTRAAARELKMRIRSTLIRTREELTACAPTADYLKALCEQGEAAVKKALGNIDAALICFDAAQIYTLHGFCHRILREFAFEAQVGFEIADPDERGHLGILEQMVKDHLKESVALPEYSPFQIRSVLKKSQGDPRSMIARLIALVSGGREIAPIPSLQELLQSFLDEIRALGPIERVPFKADLSLLTPLYKGMTGEENQEQINLLAEILASGNCNEEQFDCLLKGDFFLGKMYPENRKVRARAVEPSALHYPGLIERLQCKALPQIECAKDSSRTTLRLAADLMKKSRPLLEKQEKFSPDDLLLKVERALTIPQFAEQVRQKYRAVIVDEFQDTDPIQWNILQKLFIGKILPVCLVGDPKQSIYAFRNADVHVYLDAAQAMGNSAKKHLDTNFRSTAPLVDGLNLLFAKAGAGWMDLPGRDAPLEVIPVKSGARLLPRGDEAPIRFFIATGKKAKSKKFPSDAVLEKKVFPWIASEILKLLSNGLEPHDIAVLIKDRFQGQALVEFLKECGIPASSARGALVTDSVACEAIKELLAAALSLHDTGKLKVVLGGPFIAWNDTLLNQGYENPRLSLAKAQMQLLSAILFEEGFGPFIQKFLSISWGEEKGASCLEEMFRRGDALLYSDLRKISELLIEEEMARGLKGQSLLRYLEEIGLQHTHSEEARLKIASPEERGSVCLMTTHMSKGLEFEAVFALGIASRHKPSGHIPVKKEGRNWITSLDPKDPHCQLAIAAMDAEKMRQLYVALTRAKRHLYIPVIIEEDSKGVEPGEASPIELFLAKIVGGSDLYTTVQELDVAAVKSILDGPLIQYTVVEETVFCPQPVPCTPVCLLEPPPPKVLPRDGNHVFSFTALAKKEPLSETLKPPSDAPLSIHSLPTGSETGNLLHTLFEKIFKRGLHDLRDEKALLQLIDEEISFSPLEKCKPVFLPWVTGLLKKPLPDVDFSLSDVPRHQLQQEMEFFYPVEGGMMKGFADLLFTFGSQYYLLDWKSNYLGPSVGDYTTDRIQEVMRQNQYDLQASIYAEALRRYVKLFDRRPFSECFGGAIYYFVRGSVPFSFIPKCYPEV